MDESAGVENNEVDVLDLNCHEKLEEGEISTNSSLPLTITSQVKNITENIGAFMSVKTACVDVKNFGKDLKVCELGILDINLNKEITWSRMRFYSLQKNDINYTRQFNFQWHAALPSYKKAEEEIEDYINYFRKEKPDMKIGVAGQAYKNVSCIMRNMDVFQDLTEIGYPGTSSILSRIDTILLSCVMHRRNSDLMKTCVKSDCIAFYTFLREYDERIDFSAIYRLFKFDVIC